MRAGKLRNRGTLERATVTTSATTGKPIETWAALDLVWFDLVPIGGSERFAELQRTGTITHVITMRYQSGITSKDRLTWQKTPGATSRTFKFHAVLDRGERSRELEIHAEETHA